MVSADGLGHLHLRLRIDGGQLSWDNIQHSLQEGLLAARCTLRAWCWCRKDRDVKASYGPGFELVHDEGARIVLKVWKSV